MHARARARTPAKLQTHEQIDLEHRSDVGAAQAQAPETAAAGLTTGGRRTMTGGTGKMADLQDPVPEPEVPSVEVDWFVDHTRPLGEIQELEARERLRERMIQDLKRRGRPVNEASLAGIDAKIRQKFRDGRESSHSRSPGGTAATGASGKGAHAAEAPAESAE
jgi:hypothetical protein